VVRFAHIVCAFGLGLVVTGAALADVELPRLGFFGMRVMPLTPENVERLGISATEGAWVQRLGGTSPAREAGLAIDDVIVEVNGTPIRSVAEFALLVAPLRGGASIEATALRGSHRVSVSFELPERPLELAEGLDIEYDAFVGEAGHRLRLIRTASADESERLSGSAVLIVQPHEDGSVESGGYNLSRELAYVLARGGYTAYRFDRSGVGDSEGPDYRDRGLSGDVDELVAAARSIASRDDHERVFLLSFGSGAILGALAVTALAGDPTPPKGLVVFEAPGRGWVESVGSQMRYELERQEAPSSQTAMAANAALSMAALLADGMSIDEIAERHPDWMTLLADSAGRPFGRAAEFHRELGQVPVPDVYAVGCPILILHAEFSMRVPSGEAERIEKRLAEARHPDHVRFEVPNIDHAWVPCEAPGASLERWRDGLLVFDDAAFEPVLGWLDRRAGHDSRRTAAGEEG
jgi:pimeloyl-ACP methyl ester carboxylesterase